MNKEKKTESVKFRTTERIKNALNKKAHDEDRSISNIVDRAVKHDLGIE